MLPNLTELIQKTIQTGMDILPDSLAGLVGGDSFQTPEGRPLPPRVAMFVRIMNIFPGVESLSPIALRDMEDMDAFLQAPAPDIRKSQDIQIPGPAGEIPIRVYTPESEESTLPALIFYHGNGWVAGSLNSHDNVCRTLSASSGCIIVAVDYRLAPDHKFPAGLEDALHTYEWVRENSKLIGADASRIAVGGESSGGNLAAAVSIMARDKGIAPDYQLLMYPLLDLTRETDSAKAFDGYGMPMGMLNWCAENYLNSAEEKHKFEASPLKAESFKDLPTTHLICGDFDPVRDECIEYVKRLKEAGVTVRFSPYENMIHSFIMFSALFQDSRTAADDAALQMKRFFAETRKETVAASAGRKDV